MKNVQVILEVVLVLLVVSNIVYSSSKQSDAFSIKRSIDDLSSNQLMKLLQQLEQLIQQQQQEKELLQQQQLKGLKQPTCSEKYAAMDSKIIRTKDSLKNGATFLNTLSDISSSEECRDGCCSYFDNTTQSSCNVAVFQLHKLDNKPRCFLFNCLNSKGNFSCLFSNNTGFNSYKSLSINQNVDFEISELEELAKTAKFDDSSTTETLNVAAASVLSIKTSSAAILQNSPHSISTTASTTTLLSNILSATSTTTLLVSNQPSVKCLSQHCQKLQWKCDDGCCIFSHLVCDTIQDCYDGSDEFGCPNVSSKHFEKLISSTNPYTHHLTSIFQVLKSTGFSNRTVYVAPSKIQTTAEVSKKFEFKPNSKGDSLNSKKISSSDKNETKVDEIIVIEPEAGAILPLALGLAVTVCVLIMVACRVQTMKRKLRRHGKALAMDETDYLINGMYL